MSSNISMPSGYDPYERFFATKYKQGGRTVYAIDLSIFELVYFLPKPDPDKPLDSNSSQRRIVPKHAQDFANYLLSEPEWVSPALLLRSHPIFRFEPIEGFNTGTTQLGILSVPKDAKSEIGIVDGQHRTLGFHLAWEQLTEQIKAARDNAAAAARLEDPQLRAEHESDLADLTSRRDALAAERVSLQIVLVESAATARRIFVDINDNAKGITGSVRARFDDRTAVGRALNSVLDGSTLLANRVDLEQDRVGPNSSHLLGAKHVADVIRALAVGNGRIGRVVAQSLKDAALVDEYEAFESALISAFPVLDELIEGEVAAADLRQRHLIGSNVILRSFAAAWHELKAAAWSADEIAEAWATFDENMALPVLAHGSDSWYALGVFAPKPGGAYATTSRAQDFKTLTQFIVKQTEADGSADWTRALSENPALIPNK